MLLNVQADVFFCPRPDLSANMWEELLGKIDVALALSTRTEVGGTKQIRCLAVYIFNNSDKKFLVDDNYYDSGIQIFYMKGQSNVPLHPWENDEPPDMRDRYTMPPWIKPGQTLQIQIDLSPQELALLKSHPVKCVVPIYDPSREKKSGTIETTPKLLTEISGK